MTYSAAMLASLVLLCLPAGPPNVVVLIADDLGYGEIAPGAVAAQIPTPHIDAIDDLVFTAGYVTAPNCSPSRAGFLSGMFPTRMGYEFNPVGPRNEQDGIGLPPETVTLPEELRRVGYATGLVGKWHLGGTAPYHPHRQGFDRFFGFLHEGHYFVPAPYEGVTTWLRRQSLPPGREGDRWTRPDERMIWSTWSGRNEPDYDADNPIYRDGQPVDETDYLTTAFTREATAFIAEHRHQPFFLEVAYSAVHSPLQARDEDMARFGHIDDIQRRIFAGMLASLDDSVGQITAAIEKADIADNTIVVFFSDNGGPTAELTSSNLPLRGGKMDMYEGGLRVPMRMRVPALREQPTRIVKESVSTVDLFPTLLAAAGGTVRTVTDGIDLAPLLDAEPSDDALYELKKALFGRPLFFRQGNRAALRTGNLKLVRNVGGRGAVGPWELYDIDLDPSETTNLAEKEGDVVDGLSDLFERLNAEMSEPLF